MYPLLILAAGAVMIWIGSTDLVFDFSKQAGEIPNPPGYPDIAFFPYVLAGVIVSLPLVIPTGDSDSGWKRTYVIVMLIAALIANEEGISQFMGDVGSLVQGKGL